MSEKKQMLEAGVTYGVLLALLAAAVGTVFLGLGPWQPVVLLSIAAVQGFLLVLFFMHVRHATPLICLLASGAFLWLGILLVLVLSEYISRPWWQAGG